MNSESSEDEYIPPYPYVRKTQQNVAKKTTSLKFEPQSNFNESHGTRRQAAKKAIRALRVSAPVNANSIPRTKKRGVTKKKYPPRAKYDENGVHITSNIDLCDCLHIDCEGCFFDCQKCGSKKCGKDCRVYRKYVIDQMEYDSFDIVIENPIFLC